MKLRVQYDRRASCEYRRLQNNQDSSPDTVMQANSNEHKSQAALSLNLQSDALTRTPAGARSGTPDRGEVHIPVSEGSNSRSASRRLRTGSHSHARPHESESADGDADGGEGGASLSELRYLFHWVQKSLPFIAIVCAKLVTQHALGLAIGVGLFTTFLYANKNIQNQVFLRERRSKLQCLWLLTFLTACTLLLYYTFHAETLYYCLILVNPSIESLGFWEALWAVGVTCFILKFLLMGLKCLLTALPVSLMAYRCRGRWYMVIEVLGQTYQSMAPMPVWFRYLISYQELDGTMGMTLGVLLALFYLILKLLGLYGHWGSLQKAIRIFLHDQNNGAAATKSQCSEAGDVCPICQAPYREPRVLLCQHIFCEECISLWLHREKTCPLCRTVITDKVHKWKDGATSPHLQVY